MYAVTGASGQLGQKVVHALLKTIPANKVVALVKDPNKAAMFEKLGVNCRVANYNQAETYTAALEGVSQLLLISSSEFGNRVEQHQTVIKAAKQQNVSFIAYTSILKAEQTPMQLATDHKATEQALQQSGLKTCFLRNGWYSENYTQSLGAVLQFGVVATAAGEGQFNFASRQDYAEAAAAVLSSPEQHSGKVYELAGDRAYTMADFAKMIGEISGKHIQFNKQSEAEFTAQLVAIGLPEPVAAMMADSEKCAAQGWLQHDGKQLSQLIGRATTPLEESLRAAFEAMGKQ